MATPFETWEEKQRKSRNRTELRVLDEMKVLEMEAKMRVMDNVVENMENKMENIERKIRFAEHKKKNELETLIIKETNNRKHMCDNCKQCNQYRGD